MAETITVAHLSDVHLPPVTGFTPRHWNVKRVLGWINWQRKRRFIHSRIALDALMADVEAQAPRHILVSGDLVNIGLPAEYDAALDWLHRVGPPERVSVVPGNHDIYVPLATDPGVGRWTAYMMGSHDDGGTAISDDLRGRWVSHGNSSLPAGTTATATPQLTTPPLTPPRQEAGNRAVPGAASHAPDHGATTFPYVRRIGPVALIGLNSALPTAPGFASGRVGSAQLGRLGAALDAAKSAGLARLVMIHHPPLPGLAAPRRALADAADLAALLEHHGAELVVFGHNHRNIRTKLGAISIIGVASASAARGYKGEPAACYNLITVTRRDASFDIAIETRGFSDGGLRIGPIG